MADTNSYNRIHYEVREIMSFYAFKKVKIEVSIEGNGINFFLYNSFGFKNLLFPNFPRGPNQTHSEYQLGIKFIKIVTSKMAKPKFQWAENKRFFDTDRIWISLN